MISWTKHCPSKKAVTHASGSTMSKCMRMQNLIKIYRVVQEVFFTFSLTGSGRTERLVHLRVLQFMHKVMISVTYKQTKASVQ